MKNISKCFRLLYPFPHKFLQSTHCSPTMCQHYLGISPALTANLKTFFLLTYNCHTYVLLITPTTQTTSSGTVQGGLATPLRESRRWGWEKRMTMCLSPVKARKPQAPPIAPRIPPCLTSLTSQGHLNDDDKQLFCGTHPVTLHKQTVVFQDMKSHLQSTWQGRTVQQQHGQPYVWHFLNKCSHTMESLERAMAIRFSR